LDEPPGNSDPLLIAGQTLDSTLSFSVVAVLALIWFVIVTVEAALFTLSADDLNKLSQRKTLFDSPALWLLNYPQQVQITNLMIRWAIKVSVITIVVLLLRKDISSSWLVLITGVMVSMVILSGEVMAKYFAQRYQVSIVRVAAPLLILIVAVLTPMAYPLMALQTFIVKFLGSRSKASEKAATRVLQETLSANARADSSDNPMTQLNFASVSVKQLMKPGHHITAIEINNDFESLLSSINNSGYSRIPVYRTTPDKIEGVIYIKDLIPFMEQQRGFEWRKLLRPAFFVPESTTLTSLLREFQQKHIHMALVVDRYGRITGLVTLHDLIEEVIGDINEEFNSVNPGG
jgi:CBS domain containing-hemolysin-like protein